MTLDEWMEHALTLRAKHRSAEHPIIADKLQAIGNHHGWWPPFDWRNADPIAQGEFFSICEELRDVVLDAIAEPTGAQLVAARDWSYAEYGKPIGNDAATKCWRAMIAALTGGGQKRLTCQTPP